MIDYYQKKYLEKSYNLMYPYLNTSNEIFIEIIKKNNYGYEDGFQDFFAVNKKANKYRSLKNGKKIQLNNRRFFCRKSCATVLDYIQKYYNIELSFFEILKLQILLNFKHYYVISDRDYHITLFKIFDRKKYNHTCYQDDMNKDIIANNCGAISYGTIKKQNKILGGVYCPLCNGPARNCTDEDYKMLEGFGRHY